MALTLHDRHHARQILQAMEGDAAGKDPELRGKALELLWTLAESIFRHPHCFTPDIYERMASITERAPGAQGRLGLLLAWSWIHATDGHTARHYETFLQHWVAHGEQIDDHNRQAWRQWLEEAVEAQVPGCEELRCQWGGVDALLGHDQAKQVMQVLNEMPFRERTTRLQSLLEQQRLDSSTHKGNRPQGRTRL